MNPNELQCFVPGSRLDIPKDGSENISNGENEEEELPRPETVTVLQDELAEDADPFPSRNSDPLCVDPLSLEPNIEPPCLLIKEELEDDSEMFIKSEHSDSEDGISNASVLHVPEDDGYRSGSDQGVANKDKSENNHLSGTLSNSNEVAVNRLNKTLVEIENSDVIKGTSAHKAIPKLRRKPLVNGISVTEVNVSYSVDQSCLEVEHATVDKFNDSEVESTQNEDKRAPKQRTSCIRSKVASYLGSDYLNTSGNQFSDTRQTLHKKNMKSTLPFPKCNSPKENAEDGAKLLPLCNIERTLRVVLTRCKEAEMLVSSTSSAGQCFSRRGKNNVVPAININSSELGENEMNSVSDPRIDVQKIPVLKIRKNRDACGWEMATVGGEFSNKGSESVKESLKPSEHLKNLDKAQFSSHKSKSNNIRDLKTASVHYVENDLLPGEESKYETSVSRNETIERKEEQIFSERRNKLGKHQIVEGSDATVGKFLLDCDNQGAELKLWSCNICHKMFDNPFAMSGHTGHCKRRHEIKRSLPYTCQSEKTYCNASLLSHSATHKATRKYKCQICVRTFFALSDLKEHSQTHSVELTYKCEVCAQEFVTMKGMNVHKAQMGHKTDIKQNKDHLNLFFQSKLNVLNSLPCETDHLKFNTPAVQLQDLQELKNSSLEKNPLRDPQISILNKLSSMDNENVKHNENSNTNISQVLHSKNRNYCCELCGMKFSNNLKLKVHALIHRKRTYHLNSLKEKLKKYPRTSNVNVEHSKHHKQGKLYQCNICPKAFYVHSKFKRHLNKHKGIKAYKCELCGNAYYNPESLTRHKKSHHEQKHRCGRCGLSFRFIKQLKNHKCSFTKPIMSSDDASKNKLQAADSFDTNNCTHNERLLKVNINSSTAKYICKKKKFGRICDKTFLTFNDLKVHMKAHTGKPQCNFCHKTFSAPGRLKDHIRAWHTFEKPYQCDLCDSAYAAANSLRLHKKNKHKFNINHQTNMIKQKLIKQHQLKYQPNRKWYKCNECSAMYTTHGNLKRHQTEFHIKAKEKESIKTYKCEQCPASSDFYSSLLRHIRRFHSGKVKDESPLKSLSSNNDCTRNGKFYECNECSSTYTTPGNLKRHQTEFHLKEKKKESVKTYKCEQCPASYNFDSSLLRHIRRFHSGKIKDESPLKSLSSNNDCTRKGKLYECNECSSTYTTCGNLKRHQKEFHLKEKKKESVKTYKCEQCPASYNFYSSLLRHIRFSHSGKVKDKSALKSLASNNDCTHNGKDVEVTVSSTTNSKVVTTPKHQIKNNNFCNICKKTFSNYQGLKAHMLLHTGKKFQCNFCNKTFSLLCRLQAHVRCFHTFERPYQCNLCDKAYSGSDSLRMHKKYKHKLKGYSMLKFHASATVGKSGIKHGQHVEKEKSISNCQTQGEMYKCNECSATFSTFGYLVRHRNRYHLKNTHKESVEEYTCDQSKALIDSIDSQSKHNNDLNVGNIKGIPALKSYSKRIPYECNYCSASYSYCRTFVKHLDQKHGIKEKEMGRYQCELCHRCFHVRRNVLKHKREVHKIEERKEVTCEIEPRFKENVHHKPVMFKPSASLLRHMRCHQTNAINKSSASNSHSNDQLYKCDLCGVVFNQHKTLLEHKASFHVENKKKTFDFHSDRIYYKCNLCSAKYTTRNYLVRHKRQYHIEEQSFQCSVCLKSFSSAIVLIKHHEKHFKKLNYSCYKCGKSFKELKHLKDHMLTHSNPTSVFHCDICSLPFWSIDDLENHKQSHKFKSSLRVGQSECRELVPRKYRCDVCSKMFQTKSGLMRHKFIHANVFPYQCEVCSRAFRERYRLVLHMRTHSDCGLVGLLPK